MRNAIPTLLVSLVLAFGSAAGVAEEMPLEALEAHAESARSSGRLVEAERTYRLMLDRIDTGTGAGQALVRTLFGLGTALVLQEQGGEARALFDRAHRILRHSGESHPDATARALHGLARAALLEREIDRARSYLQRERELRLRSAGSEPLALARTLRELGRLVGHSTASETLSGWERYEVELYESARQYGQLEIPDSLEQVVRDVDPGQPAQRIHVLRAAALSNESWPNDAALADALRGIARYYSGTGDSNEGLLWFERAWLVRAPVNFVRGFEAYGAYPNWKALALSLDADGRWTFGFFTGEPSRAEAVEAALEQCRRRLSWYEIEADCRIFALNDEIVWEPAAADPIDCTFGSGWRCWSAEASYRSTSSRD